MRIKKIITVTLFLIGGLTLTATVRAEGGGVLTKNDAVTVNIKFQPIQSITVNSGQKVVDIVYETKEDYNKGVSVTKDDHLTLFSTGGFVVSVASDGDFIKHEGKGASFISAKDVVIEAAIGSNTTIGTFTKAPLSTGGETLISADKGGSSLKYNITYNNTAGANDRYINHYFHDDAESVYTAKVTYTITTN